MSALTVAQLQRKYGVSPRLVTSLVKAGVIHPSPGPKGGYLLEFQDIVLLRSAAALGRIKPAQLTRFLKDLRGKLPADAPLSSVRIALLGRELVVRIGERLENSAGQLMLDFQMDSPAQPRATLGRLERPSQEAATQEAEELPDLLLRAESLEQDQPAQAVRAYRQILQYFPECVDAALNLIVLLLESGHAAGAYRVANSAIALHTTHAVLHFNFGVVCEELERFDEALLMYQIALQLDETLADAHFNVAQIYDQRGDRRDALRHLSAYRRLQPT
jgi:tetratricopeptide (TPR) repeat protein